MLDFTGINIMGRVSNEEWGASSVVAVQEAASHASDLQIISHSLSELRHINQYFCQTRPCFQAIHLSLQLPSLALFRAFCSPFWNCQLSVLLYLCLISPWRHPLLLFLHSCSYQSKMFAKTSAVTRHSCLPADPLICLSCVDTHTHKLSS